MLVKICGLTNAPDAIACAALGADLLGFIFHPPSRRNVDPALPASINPGKAKKVGVFVQQDADEVNRIMAESKLDFAQLHGDQDEQFCRAVGSDRVIKVFWPEKHATPADLQAEVDRFTDCCAMMLFDAGTSGGGHGKPFDFTRIAGLSVPRSWLLAGGITPENVQEALLQNPDGIDMSSGVEAEFGLKDLQKVKTIMETGREGRNRGDHMKKGYFDDFGGQFVPELLMPPLIELEEAFETIVKTDAFEKEFLQILNEYVGRPSPITRCANLSKETGVDIWLKREDLNHTGAHKVNNTIGQALLTKHMGKPMLLAETGAGMHGVATATAAALLDLECVVYMGATDVVRQSVNVQRMNLLGARIESVKSGTQTLKDAINEALRFWIAEQRTAHYCFGTAAGPHPFPLLVRHFQAIISREARAQFLEKNGNLPHAVVACVGGGSNAIGAFHHFEPDEDVRLVGVEAAGTGEPGCYHSAPLAVGSDGVLHGMKTKLLQTGDGQIQPSHSIAPGLDYPGVGPEHAALHASGRGEYVTVNDAEALNAFRTLSRSEGIIPALESSHAVAWVLKNAKSLQGKSVLVCLSGRGDKDMSIVEAYLKENK